MTVLPDVVTFALQELVTPGLWLKVSVTLQLLIEELPELLTVTLAT